MKHVMLDCYGANQNQLDDIKFINDLLNQLAFELNVNPICPPSLIPYYYGKVKDDLGISAYVLLEGGHITIHTFPIRECYFVDVFYDGEFEKKKLYDILLDELPFNESKSFFNIKMRDENNFELLDYDPQKDFGPHLMSKIMVEKPLTMENLFDFLEKTTTDINMDAITRACVLKSTMKNPKYLSAIIVIAQSHIALHYNLAKQEIYADIFSCAPFDYSQVDKIYAPLGKVVSNELTARGSKHIYKVKSNISKDDLSANMKWKNYINN